MSKSRPKLRRKPKPASRPRDLRRPFVFDDDWFAMFPRQQVRVRRWHPSDAIHEHEEGNEFERGWFVIAHRNGRRHVRHVAVAAPSDGQGDRRLWRVVMRTIRARKLDSFEWVAAEEARVRAAMDRAFDPDFRY